MLSINDPIGPLFMLVFYKFSDQLALVKLALFIMAQSKEGDLLVCIIVTGCTAHDPEVAGAESLDALGHTVLAIVTDFENFLKSVSEYRSDEKNIYNLQIR